MNSVWCHPEMFSAAAAAAAAAAKSPPRLCPPWDSPGKNTGVSCHFLLQRMKVKSESEVVLLCSTLSDPMDCSLPGSSVHGMGCHHLLLKDGY